jgi:hypothetical protein
MISHTHTDAPVDHLEEYHRARALMQNPDNYDLLAKTIFMMWISSPHEVKKLYKMLHSELVYLMINIEGKVGKN